MTRRWFGGVIGSMVAAFTVPQIEMRAAPDDRPMLPPHIYCGACGSALMIVRKGGWRWPSMPIDRTAVSCFVCQRTWETTAVHDVTAREVAYEHEGLR